MNRSVVKLALAGLLGGGVSLAVWLQWEGARQSPLAQQAGLPAAAELRPLLPGKGATAEAMPPRAPASSMVDGPPAVLPRAKLGTLQDLIAGEVGAEGIAPHLQRLIDGGEDWQLFSALRVLGECRRAPGELQMMHTMMERAPGYKEGPSMLARAQANYHACQSIPSAMLAQEAALYRRVISHGMPEAAPGYLEMLLAGRAPPPPETLAEARAWVHAEASKGGVLAMRMMADGDASNPAVSAVEQRAMWHLLQARLPSDDYGGKEATVALYDERFRKRWPSFSQADEQMADARARELLAGMPPLPKTR